MTGKAFINTESDHPASLNVVGEDLVVLASGEATGGYEMFRQRGKVGQGPPPHSHDWDETFYVVTGTLAIGVGDRAATCGPGAIAHVPANTVHWFRFETDGEMISVTSRLGASKFFQDLDRSMPPGPPEPAALATLAAVAERNGLTIHAPG